MVLWCRKPIKLTEKIEKICRVHREEGPGAILVFVTVQEEVKRLVARLRKTFPDEVKQVTEIDPDQIKAEPERTRERVENYHADQDDDEFGEVDYEDEFV